MKLLSVFLLFITSGSIAQAILGDGAEISVITCSPGDELYSVFGHSAIRIYEPGVTDYVYNYGTFQFDDDFYLKFAQGKLNYRLSRSTFESFNYEYIVTGRGVYEQVLDLNAEEKQRLYEYLEHNFKPENRYYLYDFFFDNCATRIRDVLNQVLGDDLTYHSNFAPDSATFRNMIDLYLVGMPWADFGIDLALGAPCDAKLKAQENMFLPDFVYTELERAKLGNRMLVRESRELLPAQFVLTPARLNPPVLLAALITVWFFASLFMRVIANRSFLFPERVLLFVVGLVGIVVFLLWFATDHVTTRNNWNLMWASPLHAVVAFYVKRLPRVLALLVRGFTIILLIFCIAAWLFPQEFHPASYLLGLSMFLVYLRIDRFPSK